VSFRFPKKQKRREPNREASPPLQCVYFNDRSHLPAATIAVTFSSRRKFFERTYVCLTRSSQNRVEVV
jgi:hypothetical protein